MSKSVRIDFSALERQVDGDLDLLAEIVRMFLDGYPEAVSRLGVAVRARDSKAVETNAHCLRGYLVNLPAIAASMLALQLEVMGRYDHCEKAEVTYVLLQSELALLAPAIDSWLKQFEADNRNTESQRKNVESDLKYN